MTMRLQVRHGNKPYRTVESARYADELAWAFKQWLAGDGVRSVRIVDPFGRTYVRADRKKE